MAPADGRARRASPARERALLWAAAGALVICTVVAVLALGGSGEEPAPSAGKRASAAPAEWTVSDARVEVTGFRFGEPVHLVHDVWRTDMVVGVLPAESPGLLPSGLLQVLDQAPPQPMRVFVGERPAYHYRDLTDPQTGRALEVFVVPVAGGVATAACTAVEALRVVLYSCAEAARSVLPLRGRPLALTPETALRQRLPEIVGHLNATLRDARAGSGGELTAAAKASALTLAARGYDGAARALGPLAPGRKSTAARLVVAMGQLARAYERLAILARDGATGLDTTRRAVLARKVTVDRMLGTL